MRIISGIFKGKKINEPLDKETRLFERSDKRINIQLN